MVSKDTKAQERLQKAPTHGTTVLRPIRTDEAMAQGKRAMSTTLITQSSLWDTYVPIYKLRLGEAKSVMVCERKGISFDLVDIRTFRTLNKTQLKMLQTVQHPNFVTVHEIFQDADESHVACEHMPRSLVEAAGNPYLDSPRLAAIVKQILDALAYLEERDMHHGHLTCSQVYLHPTGKIKICGQESCSKSRSSKDLRDLGYIMMELMDGYLREGNNIGLDEPGRWHPDAVNFLCTTETCTSSKELLQHEFLRLRGSRQPDILKGFSSLVMAWTKPSYEYLGWQSRA